MSTEGLLPVRPAERRAVFAGFGTLFLVLAAHALVETARDALFLSALPVERLPWVYLGVALLGPLLGSVPFEAGGRKGLFAWLFGSAVVLLGLWAWVGAGGAAARVALYLWSGVSVSVALLQAWHLLSQRFALDAAKRVFGVVGAGSVLGAVFGAAAGGAVSRVLPVEHLLLGAAGLYVLAAAASIGLGRGRSTPLRLRSLGVARDLRAVLDHPYARRLVGLAALAAVTSTLVDYLLKEQVVAHVAPGDLGPWFATFYTVTNAVALAVQVLVTGATIRALGVGRAVAVLPALLLLGASGLAAGVGLGAAVLLKGAEGSLKHTLHRTAIEVLFVPVPEELRARTRRVGDLLVLRLAQGAGSVLILGVLALGGGGRVVAGATVLLVIGWLALAVALRGPYLALFRDILRRGGAAVGVVPALDLQILEALIQALDSDDDDEVLAALDLLRQYDRVRVVPSLLLYHPSRPVVVRALDLFAEVGREDHLPKTLQLAASPDPEIRAAVIRSQPDHSFALRGMQDPAPIVRCTALAVLLTDGGPQARSVQPVVQRIVAQGTAEERMALARALAAQPHGPMQVELVARLTAAPTARERAAAAACIAANPVPAHLPAAIRLLGTREARRDARRAIVANGQAAIPALAAALDDPDLPEGVRIHVPAALADVPGPETARVLADRLNQGESGVVRYRILRALNRHNGVRPDVPIPREPLRESVRSAVRSLYVLLDWSIVLDEGVAADPTRRTPGYELLVTLLADKRANVLERLFRALDMLHRDEDFDDLWRGGLSDDPRRRASSIELLEDVLPAEFRDAIVGLVDQSRDELPRLRRLAPGEGFYTPGSDQYVEVLRAMLTAGSDSVQAIAAYHVGERQLVALLPALAAIDLSRHPTTAEVIVHAIEKLEQGPVSGEAS